MTATERLRAMLDELGVEHEGGERSVRWRDRYGIMMQAFPLANGELGMGVWSCTPEQAIAATLGDADLAAENAKLRELVRLMVRRHTPISPCKNIPCGECPVKDECDQEDALMRELGVEVDG